MKRILFFLVCLFLIGGMIGFVGPSVETAEAQGMTFELPSTDPAGSFQVESIEYFANLVEEKTEGQIKIDVYPSGQLGTQQEEHQAFITGALKMVVADPASMSQLLSDTAVFNFPYLFRDAKHAFKAVNPDTSEVMKEISDRLLEERGIRIVGGIFWRGFRQLTTKGFPVYKSEDLAGKKIRAIENKIWVTMVEGMGAIATPIDFTETPTALMTGIVDGQENPLSTIYDNCFYPPVQEYLMLTNHLGAVMLFVVREDAWEKLDPKYQGAIKEAMNETAEWSIVEIDKRDKELLRKLEDKGMTIISEDDGLDVEAFRAKVIAHAKEKFPEWNDYINKLIEIE